MLNFLNNPELERLCEQQYNDTLNKIDMKVKLKALAADYELAAYKGDSSAMFQCFEIYRVYENLDGHSNPYQTSRHAYRYLQQAAEHGNTEAVSMYACLIAFGEIPGRGKWDVEPNPQEALRICDYYTKEALNDEKVKQTIQILKKAAGNRGGNQSSSEGCYIATAVYGDYDAPEVLVLRSFRDGVLLKSFWGKVFVKIYYFLSPPLANYLKNYDGLNNKVKSILDKFVDFLKHNS